MNKLTIALGLTAVLLAGCGGGSNGGNNSSNDTTGSNNDGGGNNNNDGNGYNNGGNSNNNSGSALKITPVTPLNKVAYKTTLGNGIEFETKAGYDGDITAVKKVEDFGGRTFTSLVLKLKNGTPSLNIVDIKKTELASYNCSSPVTIEGKTIRKGSMTTTYDYKSGKVTKSGKGDGAQFGCTSTFRSHLPTTIADEDSIDELLNNWGDNTDRQDAATTGLITTNCPQPVIDNSNPDTENLDKKVKELGEFLSKCKNENVTNYVITDDTGKKHKLAIQGGSLPYGIILLLGIGALIRRKFKEGLIKSHEIL